MYILRFGMELLITLELHCSTSMTDSLALQQTPLVGGRGGRMGELTVESRRTADGATHLSTANY